MDASHETLSTVLLTDAERLLNARILVMVAAFIDECGGDARPVLDLHERVRPEMEPPL